MICVVPTNIEAKQNIVSEEYLEEWKDTIGKNSYFVYTPKNEQELINLDENKVIAIFEGVKVTKKLLNENLELDINKITTQDFINDNYVFSLENKDFNNQKSSVVPYAMALPNISGSSYDGSYLVPSSVKSVVVTRHNYFSDGTNNAQVIHYLSIESYEKLRTAINTHSYWEDAITYFLDSLFLAGLPLYLSVTMGVLIAFAVSVEEAFKSKVNNIYLEDKKAKVKFTVDSSYRSIVKWTDDYFYARNGTLNGSVFKSNVEFIYK